MSSWNLQRQCLKCNKLRALHGVNGVLDSGMWCLTVYMALKNEEMSSWNLQRQCFKCNILGVPRKFMFTYDIHEFQI